MKDDNLKLQLEHLNQHGGISYQIMLGGIFALHGREAVIRVLAKTHAGHGNVVSIATAPNWCWPRSQHVTAGPATMVR
jgi:hypothetical protein